MKLFKAPLIAAMVGVSALGLTVAAPTETQAQSSVPVDVWALRSVVNAVQVSPDGKHVLVHINPSREGEYLLQVYKTDDLSKPFRTINADPMEIIAARWVSNDYIFGTAWQVNRSSVKRPEQDIRDYLAFSYNPTSNKINKVEGDFSIVNTLPTDPDRVLIGTGNAIPNSSGVDPFSAFRPRAYYKFDLKKGTKSLVMKGNSKFPRVQLWDNEGNPRYTSVLDSGDGMLKEYYRKPGDGSWTLFQETDMEDQGNLYRILGGFHGIAGLDPNDPNTGYFIDNRDGEDKAALYKFDFNTGTVGEKLFQPENADVTSIQTHSIPGNDKLVAARYAGAKRERHWFDEDEKALHEALVQQIPYAHNIGISSRSLDGRTMIVQNSGPKDPGSFWMVKDGKIAKLGSRNPHINQEQLSEVKYIRYKARDGLEIPGYVTMPKGEGPFPLIVQHNGGPHVNGMVSYDEMGQMLASAGYMVLHPENRISTGWGQKHFDAGYGEHGLRMQDDKDDGVKYLIEQGLADPDRVAFFGWSYGGYAALVAASREENLYQCSIAVAAVADAEKQYMGRRNTDLKALDAWSKRRGMIGVNPINEVSKVNIPLLMIHGDDDRRVMYYHFKDYKKAFEAAGKQGQFLTMEGADHFSNTLMYNHQQQLYTKMLDFLANDCGPGGL
uniref:alpha/beta hydrolase family protein n=1 Tax=uncultured Erythrobacter sp. TaxID=263913 RepID=UPI0026030887|nr:prolyl oligopeptidase family serine peptidase [uncultured Erythrobacter sp.]